MPILVDISQLLHANVMVMMSITGTEGLDDEVFKKMVVASINKAERTFGPEYGEVILCRDGNPDKYWRRQVFPHYKASRRKSFEENEIDWAAIYKSMHDSVEDICNRVSHKVLLLEDAEADDMIAVTAMNKKKLTLILSADKDFIQLQRFPHVFQYSPLQKSWIRHGTPNAYRKEHILYGDRGDGIPNFLSDGDCFVTGKRQKPIYRKKLDEWLHQKPQDFCDEQMLIGYRRNKQLIDFNEIPRDVQIRCLELFDNSELGG